MYVFKIPNFKNHKKQLMNLINKIPLNPLITNLEKISHQDYNLPREMNRDYWKYFYKHLLPFYEKKMLEIFKYNQVKIIDMWFQVYKPKDFHSFHTHPKAHFTNVLFIKLPEQILRTEVHLPNKKIWIPEISEGDIITFPAYLRHQSPINNSKKDKVVISFNTDIL